MATTYPKGWRGSLQSTIGFSWNRLTNRAGNNYGHGRRYEEIEVRMAREEFVAWAIPAYTAWFNEHPDVTPALDRIDTAGHYEIGNIRLISQRENILRREYSRNVNAPAGMAWCGWCKQYLPVSHFYKSTGTYNGLMGRCKACIAAINKAKNLPHLSQVYLAMQQRRQAPSDKNFCGDCARWLPRAAFHSDKTKATGLYPLCRSCYAIRRGRTPRQRITHS
jgi:hypothetical protein